VNELEKYPVQFPPESGQGFFSRTVCSRVSCIFQGDFCGAGPFRANPAFTMSSAAAGHAIIAGVLKEEDQDDSRIGQRLLVPALPHPPALATVVSSWQSMTRNAKSKADSTSRSVLLRNQAVFPSQAPWYIMNPYVSMQAFLGH
jgi:hypothetical protein